MPYMGQDWRAPGQEWYRTADGWRKNTSGALQETIENVSTGTVSRQTKSRTVLHHGHQPSVVISPRCSRERVTALSLGETINKLDMCQAARDLNRFRYVCKILQVFAPAFPKLSGSAQIAIINVLEAIIDRVVTTKNDMDTGRALLDTYKHILEAETTNHIGSRRMWDNHTNTVSNLRDVMHNLKVPERKEDGALMLAGVPDDCIYQVLRRITHHQDLINIGLTSERMFHLVRDSRLWQKLCYYHFSPKHIQTVQNQSKNIGWLAIYYRLYKKYGSRDDCYETLSLCNFCNSIFWHFHGHECLHADKGEDIEEISPKVFMNYFVSV